jgi:proteasome assembly chaperone (PAC2) family protein
MRSQYLRIHDLPKLKDARLVMGFTGWMDGGDVSIGTVEYLIDSLGADRIADINPTPFYIYNMPGSMEVTALFRPHVRIADGLIEDFDEPDNAFYCVPDRNLVLFTGKEPNLAWPEFADCILDLAEACGVSMLHFVGSVAGLVPHTREPRYFGSVSNADMLPVLEQNDIVPSDYDGPASFITYLTTRARQRGMSLTTLVAGIPTYVEGKNTKCIKTTVQKIGAMLSLDLNLKELERMSAAFERELDETIQERPELAEQIRKIEAIYDQETTESRDDDLRDWFEKQGFHTE